MSVESDQPPQLHAFIGTTNDDVPPILPPEHNGEAPPLLRPMEEYNTDDDEAPPQLSPVLDNNDEVDPELDPDKQPMAPLTEEQRHFMAMDQPPKAPIKQMDEEHVSWKPWKGNKSYRWILLMALLSQLWNHQVLSQWYTRVLPLNKPLIRVP